MCEAARDLVNAEEEQVGEWRGGVGKEGVPLDDEEFPHRGTDGVGLLTEETVEAVGDKQDSAEVKTAGDAGVGEDTGMCLKGEEQGGAWTEEALADLRGEGERWTRLALETEGMGLVVLRDDPDSGSSGFLKTTTTQS